MQQSGAREIAIHARLDPAFIAIGERFKGIQGEHAQFFWVIRRFNGSQIILFGTDVSLSF